MKLSVGVLGKEVRKVMEPGHYAGLPKEYCLISISNSES